MSGVGAYIWELIVLVYLSSARRDFILSKIIGSITKLKNDAVSLGEVGRPCF